MEIDSRKTIPILVCWRLGETKVVCVDPLGKVYMGEGVPSSRFLNLSLGSFLPDFSVEIHLCVCV